MYNYDTVKLASGVPMNAPIITLDGAALPDKAVTLDHITVTPATNTVAAPKTGENAKTVVLTATGYESDNTAIDSSNSAVSGITWKLYTDSAATTEVNASNTKVSIDSTGKVTAAVGAKAGTYYAVASKGNVKSDPVTITVTRETTMTYSGFAITGGDSVAVDKTITLSASKTVTNQYGESVNVDSVTWTSSTTNATVTNGTVKGVAVGETTITATATIGGQANAANATKKVTVSAKELKKANITGKVIEKVYDGTDTLSETKTFDTDQTGITAEVSNIKFADKNVGENKAVTYDITLKGTNASDYEKGTVSITGKITEKSITVAPEDVTVTSKAYDGTTDATVIIATPDGVLNGDTVTVTGTAKFADANVGAGKTVTVSGLTLDGTDKANYKLSSTTVTAAGDITGEAVTVSPKATATITGTSPKLSDLLTATPAGVDLDKIAGATVKYYEKVVTPADDDAGTPETTTYKEVAAADLKTGNTYYVDVSFGKQTIGNYEVAALNSAKTGDDLTDAEAAKCVALTCNAPASSGGYTGGTTAPAPQEETPTVIDSFIKGYEDGTVGPNNSLTRAETAVIMARLSKGFDKDSVYYGSAPDVQPGEASDWYYTHVNYDIQKGIINGYPDGNFYPNEKITRAEFAAMLARFMGLDTTGTASFDDVNTEEYAWASGYVAALEKVGVVNGYEGSNDFKPGAPISRAEAIKMIVIALGVDTETATQNTSVEVPSDLSTSHWAYKYIMAALSTDVADIAR
jgi:hypothetical protein